MRYFVTGCAGFIGSNVADHLLRDGHRVMGYDNFSTGQPEFLAEARRSADFTLVRGDTLDLPALTRAMAGADMVIHLAANADVRFGTEQPRKDAAFMEDLRLRRQPAPGLADARAALELVERVYAGARA